MTDVMTRDGARAATPAFDALNLHPDLLRAVVALEFERTTPIQAEAIPPALERRDVLACAATGSGKTAAFLLPILDRLHRAPGRGTRALILTPTRELAAQVTEHGEQLARYTRLRCAAVYGGVGMSPQVDAFRRGADIIVATPGRLLDHMQHTYARMPGLEVLVLDEADRMLDMGFLPDIRRILRQLPATPRQTLFFSATMPQPIVELSRELLHRPAMLRTERKSAPAQGVAQAFYPVPSKLKPALLLALLEDGTVGNAIVFCRTKHRANRLAHKLEKAGIAVARIHGNRSQNQRTEALAGFKDGRYRVLVATDIVARGIDVEALDHVVNFDVPNAPEDYIHRVGRTARAGLTGDAYTLVSPEEEGEVRAIERAVGRSIERRRIDGFDYRAAVAEQFEVPIGDRIAEIRARKKEERARAAANAERRARQSEERAARPAATNGRGGARPAPSHRSADAHGDAAQREEGGRSRRRRGRRGGAGRSQERKSA
jgi:ATP-dependent RNA helicase RhlE